MLRLLHHRFLRGPSVLAPQAGLLIELQADAGAAELQWRLPAAHMAGLLDRLHPCIPAAGDSPGCMAPARMEQAAVPLLTLMLAVAEAIVRDFCVLPARGSCEVRDDGHIRIFLPCDEAATGRAAWAVAQAVAARIGPLARGEAAAARQVAEAYRDARRAARANGLNLSTLALVRAAARRGIPHHRLLPSGQLTQLGQGVHARRIMETGSDAESTIAIGLAQDKLACSRLLDELGLPTPGTRRVKGPGDALEIATAIGWPVVVKPRALGKGAGVTVDVKTPQALQKAMAAALALSDDVVLERHIPGDDHRLLVVGGRFLAAARRVPAEVTGDGVRTVEALVAELNRDPRRGMPFERVLETVVLDDEADVCLRAQGLGVDSVPPAGARVRLRGTANLSRGGMSIDVTETLHPDNRALAERAAAAVGLHVAGIDVITPDITRSWREVPCAILEVNGTPGLRPHLASNPGRDIAGPIVASLFPDGNGRVPTAVALDAELARRLSDALSGLGIEVAAQAHGLCDPAVRAAVLPVEAGELALCGLPVDSMDVAVLPLGTDDNDGSRALLARCARQVVEVDPARPGDGILAALRAMGFAGQTP